MTGRERVLPAPSGTVTFLFTDIEGSTQRWDHDRRAMQDAVRLHDRLMREAIAAHDGYVFKTIGDAFCAAFTTVEAAALTALDAQSALGAADFSTVDGLRVRMAINTGTADERDGDYFGPTLNRVARLLALGHGGQVLLSGVAAELVRENPPLQATLADLGAHALKDLERHEQVYQLVAPGLQRDFPELRAKKALGPWLVPEAMRTRYFTGRDDLLAVLRQQILEHHRAALSGLGGVGKTQTAIEYAARHRAKYPDGVFWVNAETPSGLTSGFVEIAKTLQLPSAESSDQTQVVKAVREWLCGTDRWLLILDNVDERDVVGRFVPEHGAGHVLITSRESVFAELGIPRALDVRDFDRDEAVRFLLARTGRHENVDPREHAAANELAQEVGNLPLALEQAAAYIAETNAAFSAYLGAFRKRRVTLLEKASGFIAHDTVAVTWAANFEAVERVSAAAADVLRLSALLAPDAIPFELFVDGARALGNSIAEALADPHELAMAEVLRPLGRYSLIRPDAISRNFSVHRLVQEIAWAAVAEPERHTYLERAVCALEAAFPVVEYATWAQCERLVPHVESIARWVESYDLPEAAARVLNRAGHYLRERGRYAGARALSERALAIGERALGSDHPDVARSLNDLAVVHWYQGRFAEAQALNERALAIRERTLGPEHLDVASSLNTLAIVHSNQGHYAEAEVLLARALAIRVSALGPEHPFVAHSLSNLATLHDEQGRTDRAQPLFERALAIRERALGPNHPDLAGSLNNLAGVRHDQGRLTEAQALSERALAIAERALGPDHPDVGFSLNNTASIYVDLGRYAEAEVLYERARAARERALGPDHPSVAESLTGLANLYLRQSRHADAEPLFERALDIRERALGRDHVHVARTLVGLASLRRDQGRENESVTLYERALAINERTLTAGHPVTARTRQNLDALRTAMTASTVSPAQENGA